MVYLYIRRLYNLVPLKTLELSDPFDTDFNIFMFA